jgi:hypothetical protein
MVAHDSNRLLTGFTGLGRHCNASQQFFIRNLDSVTEEVARMDVQQRTLSKRA